jgi:RND family efflux transporter MFP subunit
MRFLLRLLKLSLPFLILGGGIACFMYLHATKPVAERRAAPEPVVKVETQTLEPEVYTVRIHTQGTVRARTESTLLPEVSGRILEVSPNFREGGFFDTGDLLLKIDPSDYQTAVIRAKASLAEARVRLAEEEAQASQAERDWDRLGSEETPPDLVLRGPQLALARANVAAAEANLAEAERNLARTEIRAPYEGRVLNKHVDVGQVVSQGTLLADVYAVDYAEIRLPLTTEEFAMLDLPEGVRGGVPVDGRAPVTLKARFGPREIEWKGKVIRAEGAVDTRSRQLYVIAQVDDPYGLDQPEPLKVGLFVEAEIEGMDLEDVYVVPRVALREAAYVLSLTEDNRIRRVAVDPIWSSEETIVFREPSLSPGSRISLTQMALAIDGMQVQPIPQDAAAEGGVEVSASPVAKRRSDTPES